MARALRIEFSGELYQGMVILQLHRCDVRHHYRRIVVQTSRNKEQLTNQPQTLHV